MAFRQPTFHAPQRVYTAPAETQAQTQSSLQSRQHTIADSQEWILFSPSAASTTDRGCDTSTAQPRTAGHSRISDFGSLDTAARSYDYDEASEDAIEEEEDGELDSLDSHLHAFRAESSVYRESAEASGTVLPTHDGLGSFRLDQTNMGEDVQDHLYVFERYNPRRVKRRRESVEIGMLELEGERAAEAERTRRIEKWRMEQSRLLVDEIQKETRRRKQSMSSERRTTIEEREQEDVATLSHVSESERVPDEENDTFWNRITKRVIQDLMGIDDDLLAIIFGESLPEGDDNLSTTPPAATSSVIPTKKYDVSCWEHRLLERVARELGILVSQLTDHPGAFSTYLHSQQTPLPYAGLQVIPEFRDQPILEASAPAAPATPQFRPTIPTEPVSIPIPSTSLAPAPLLDEDATPRANYPLSQAPTREEWERDLDIKMVFRYLRSRFTSKFKTNSQTTPPIDFTTSGTSHLATASTADAAARAARVRQHHPLVTRQTSTGERRRSIERRTWRASVPGSSSPIGIIGPGIIGRGSSSCASERLSINGHGVRNSGSSRHYWDFGGQSVRSGSLIASTGGMGSWGEV